MQSRPGSPPGRLSFVDQMVPPRSFSIMRPDSASFEPAYSISLNSTRRFSCLPSGVSFVAIGRFSPRPRAE